MRIALPVQRCAHLCACRPIPLQRQTAGVSTYRANGLADQSGSQRCFRRYCRVDSHCWAVRRRFRCSSRTSSRCRRPHPIPRARHHTQRTLALTLTCLGLAHKHSHTRATHIRTQTPTRTHSSARVRPNTHTHPHTQARAQTCTRPHLRGRPRALTRAGTPASAEMQLSLLHQCRRASTPSSRRRRPTSSHS